MSPYNLKGKKMKSKMHSEKEMRSMMNDGKKKKGKSFKSLIRGK